MLNWRKKWRGKDELFFFYKEYFAAIRYVGWLRGEGGEWGYCLFVIIIIFF